MNGRLHSCQTRQICSADCSKPIEKRSRVDPKGHGIITATVGDIDSTTDGFPNNERLYLPPTVFDRFAVTREINDGSLAPRFFSEPAWLGIEWLLGKRESHRGCVRRTRRGRSLI
jgi:hypothetical protein